MPSVHVHGCPIHYEIRGTGPQVLFIQGVGVHGDGWRPQVDAFSSRFSCLTFDNRGIGRSQPANGRITMERLTEDAIAVMDAAGWNAAHIVGHSLGGLIALSIAVKHSQRVRSLSLLCTFADGREAAPFSPRMIWSGLRSRIGTRSMRRHGFLGLILTPAALAAANVNEEAARLLPLFGHDLADQPKVTFQYLRAMRGGRFLNQLPTLGRVPTLVMSAALDPIAPPRCGRTIAAGIPRARFVEVPDASHGLPITHASAVNASVAAHIEALGR